MKKINVMGTEMDLTDERRNRIISAMTETQEKLNKELSYSEDLQHADVIEFYRQHIAKLVNMLQ